MLEFILVWRLCKKLGSVVEAKGYRSGWWKALLVLLWLTGEFCGGFVGAVLIALLQAGDADPPLFFVYLCAVLGAALGAGATFFIAWSLTPLTEEPDEMDDWDEDEDDQEFEEPLPPRSGPDTRLQSRPGPDL